MAATNPGWLSVAELTVKVRAGMKTDLPACNRSTLVTLGLGPSSGIQVKMEAALGSPKLAAIAFSDSVLEAPEGTDT